MDSLWKLNRIMPPPQTPVEVPTERDEQLTELVTGKLPKDYFPFLRSYGSGSVAGFITIFSPASLNPHLNLLKRMTEILEDKRQMRKADPTWEPIPLFPEPNGIIPLGCTGNGNEIFWRTRGNPERWSWPILVWEPRGAGFQEFDCDLTSFLVQILSRETICNHFPDDFPESSIAFEPYESDVG